MLLNYLVTDISRLASTEYFQYIIQFENQLAADIWFMENDFHTEESPFYSQEFECTAFLDTRLKMMDNFLRNNHINQLYMLETEYYRVLFFTEYSCQKFTARIIEGCADKDDIEIQAVDKQFLYGFVTPTKKQT